MYLTVVLVLVICFGKAEGSTTSAVVRNISDGTTVTIATTTTRKLTTTLLSTTPCVRASVGSEWRKEDFPNPQVDVTKCGRNCQKSWICDPNNVITDRFYLSEIEFVLTRIRSNGRCGCTNCTGSGYKISVAMVNKIRFQGWETVSSTTQKQRAQEFASYLRATSWHPSGTCEDDVVIFVSRGDRQVQTAVGPRAIGVLNTNCIEYVYKSVRSDLTSGYYGKAVDTMVKKYEQAILTGQCQDVSGVVGMVIGIVFGVIGVVVAVVVAVCICRNAGQCNNYGGGVYYSGHPYHYHHRGGWGRGGGGGGGGGGFSGFSSGDGGGGGGGGF